MKASYNGIAVPPEGKPIGYSGGKFSVPDTPILPFIEGDGTGRDIWKASRRVFDAAVEKAYGSRRRVAWLEVEALADSRCGERRDELALSEQIERDHRQGGQQRRRHQRSPLAALFASGREQFQADR